MKARNVPSISEARQHLRPLPLSRPLGTMWSSDRRIAPLFWAQFFVTWYGNLPHEYAPLWAQLYGNYAPYFWAQIICIIAIPIGTMIFARTKRTLWAMLIIAAIMNLGVWINRYLMVLPALSKDHHLFASPVEIALVLAPMTGYLLALLLLFNIFPMVSSWELRSIPRDHH